MQAVVPHVCAWIETVRASRSWLLPEVAPRVGAQFQRNRLRGAPEAAERGAIFCSSLAPNKEILITRQFFD